MATRALRRAGIAIALGAVLAGPTGDARERDPARLAILGNAYPRAFFFRAAEGAQSAARYPTYESWEKHFDRLQGIMGKCLEEECLGREKRNPEFFSRFKERHPEQAVLLHFNGNSRDPRYHTEGYFPGHWIYRRATEIVADVPAEAGETAIHVKDASDFRVESGRYRTSADDIALFGTTPGGTHDWAYCEQVQLLAVDPAANTITVRRACYGTRPLAFRAGAARAAAHMTEGPWGKTNNLLWFYNLATHCPRDAQGRTCADVLVEDLAAWFGPGGLLEAFDGIEFDVMFHETRGDTDGDGTVDNGVVRGVNGYGVGVVEFARRLRARLGDGFLIQGDGALGPGGSRSQRAWGILNGIESEGWPNLPDWEMDDWSGGMNRHFYWRDHARPPVFNYVNHKWTEPVPGEPGTERHPDVPFSRHRLVFAACQFFDAMVCYSFAPKNDPDGLFGVWDELRQGVDQRPGWLGAPEGPARRLAMETPDLLAGRGQGEALARALSGPAKAAITADGVRLERTAARAGDLSFALRDIPTRGPDLYLTLEMSAAPMPGCPPEMARFVRVAISGGIEDLLSGPPPQAGTRLRGAPSEVPLDPATGATARCAPQTLAGETLPALFTHPPWRNGTGYTFWTRDVDVPAAAELRFAIGMGERSPERSDGVWFAVDAIPLGADGSGDPIRLFEADTTAHRWLRQRVSLAPYAGQRLRLKFIADCGPADNATTDHASWGDVKVLRAGITDASITTPVSSMTWAGTRLFASSFSLHDVRSPTVDLQVTVEGPAPVCVRAVTAHAHPDAVCRVFARGLVLANPSRRPYAFDLERLSPGRHYRRLQGTPTQDPQTNNGEPVGPTVTLGERDGLFLLRTE